MCRLSDPAFKLWMGTFTYPTELPWGTVQIVDGYIHVPDGLYLGGILKVGTLAKDQYIYPHARVRVAVS